jgi:hypothetical protein
MRRVAGIVLVVVGVVLLILGLRAMDSFSSQFSRFFTGSPTDRAVWMTIAGIAGIALGAAAAVLPLRLPGR